MKNNKEIFQCLKALLNDDEAEITAMPQSGSPRIYFRIKSARGSFVGTYNSNIEENKAFITYSKHFFLKGLPVSRILAVSEEMDCYIQSDFGDDTLFNHVTNEGVSEKTLDYYKEALEHLVDFQIKGHQGLDYSVAFPTPSFDKQSIMDDMNYFRYYFLKLHDNIVFNEKRLNDDFIKLTDFMLEAPSDYFMYRDFQSRNIMICNGFTKFIDYQGGRKGPLQYDVASLLYQVKAKLPESTRKMLLEHYKKVLSRYVDADSANFDKYFHSFVILRLMQVLGAYGFRGIIQKKQHFIESIPLALNEILHQIDNLSVPFELPELRSAVKQLETLLPRYQTVEPKQLTVVVNSFSYKNGGAPDDFSGNGGGFVFDCRALPNPGRLVQFMQKTGMDPEVQSWLDNKPETNDFMQNAENIVSQAIDNYLGRGFKNLSVSFGCTGGQHRSVFCANRMAECLSRRYPQIVIELIHTAQHKSFVYGK